jgi:AAA15 family ATPase/GTPase
MQERNGLSEISIKNFRALNGKFHFDFAPLTILTGTNSSGKSSIAKALLLLKNMVGDKVDSENPFRNFSNLGIDSDLNIGTFDFWVNNKQDDDKTLSFTFPFYFINVLNDYSLELTYSKREAATPYGELCQIRIYNNDSRSDIFVVDKTQFRFNFVELWSSIEEFYDKLSELQSFVEKISHRYNDLALSWENYSGGGFDIPSNIVYHFLSGTMENYKSLYDVETCTYEMFVSVLSAGEIEEFNHFRDTVFLTSAWKFNNNKNRTSIYFPLVEIDYPLLTYDILNKPKYSENNASNPIPSMEMREYSEKLKVRNKELSDKQKVQLKKIQKIELQTLNEALPKIFSNDSKSVLGPITAFIVGKLEYFFKKLFEPSIDRTFEFDENYCSYKISEFEMEMEKKQGESELFSINWILNDANEKNFRHGYGYHANKDNFFEDIILNSIRSNIEATTNSFQLLEFIPATRNPMADRYYSLKEKSNYFSKTIANLITKDEHNFIEIANKMNSSLSKLGIAEKLHLSLSDDGSYIVISLGGTDKRKINLADHGNGINQLLPIIMKIGIAIENYFQEWIEQTAAEQRYSENAEFGKEKEWFHSKPVFIIEEPEMGLHPSLQSKLADVLVEWSRHVNLIVETHSEYLIRRLRGLVVDGTAKPNQIKIYYFHDPSNIPEGESQVYPIDIDSDGSLSKNFGKGFLDEASNLNIALYNYSKEQHN